MTTGQGFHDSSDAENGREDIHIHTAIDSGATIGLGDRPPDTARAPNRPTGVAALGTTIQPHLVPVSWGEVQWVVQIGVARTVQAFMSDQRDMDGQDRWEVGWQVDAQGALGEYVLAKALRRFWPAYSRQPVYSGDVGRMEARFASRSGHSLIVREKDIDERPLVLVVPHSTTPEVALFRIPGWLHAGDGKRTEWWHDGGNGRPPAWFVPQDALLVFDRRGFKERPH